MIVVSGFSRISEMFRHIVCMRFPPLARTRSSFVCLLILLVFASANADELRLKNGDRYTGTVVTLDKGSLKFDTGHGTLDVPWADVTSLTLTAPVVMTVAGREQTVTFAAGPDGQVAVAGGAALRLADITAMRRPEGPLRIDGGANAGVLSSGGNTDVNSLHFDGEVVAREYANRYTAGGWVNRSVDHGRETSRNATGALRYDRFISRRMYLSGSSLFTYDRFRDFDLRTALGVGVGYQVADNDRLKLGVEGGYGYVNENFATQPDDSYHAARDSVLLDVFVGGKRFDFFHRHDAFFGLTGDDNLFVQTRNGVRIRLAGGLVTTVEYDIEYDRSPAIGRKKTDHAFGWTLGYRF
jgi:putative salt-induced outer membrane protein YdiY